MKLMYIALLYGFAFASLICFIAMQLRLRMSQVYIARAEAAKARRCEGDNTDAPLQPLKVVFLHPDLGIGGAERLVVDAAMGLKAHQSRVPVTVHVITNHHDKRRAFKETTDGSLHVTVCGGWFPRSIFGRCSVLCATVRMALAAFQACWTDFDADCFVVDQVAAAMIVLHTFAPRTPRLFYCHFPDQKCDPNRTEDGSFKSGNAVTGAAHRSYRSVFDQLEEWAMTFATSIVCNSRFTCGVTLRTFPNLMGSINADEDVLYPPVSFTEDADKYGKEVEEDSSEGGEEAEKLTELVTTLRTHTAFVSINRYERKKDVALAIHAFARLLPPFNSSTTAQESNDNIKKEDPFENEAEKATGADVVAKWTKPPLLVIAGGYDPRLPENEQCMKELRTLAFDYYRLPETCIRFLQNIRDVEKTALLRHACALLYTPSNEHFGIVPVEAMWHGLPVIAVAHGGPCESVGDKEEKNAAGGVLCEATPEAFADAMIKFGSDPEYLHWIGECGKRRARACFTLDQFSDQLVARIQKMVTAEQEALADELIALDATNKTD